MPDIKKNFTAGRMNKDLDERLVRNGEYRDAMNIQVRTTDGDSDGLGDSGVVQNIQGNIEIGKTYIDSNLDNPVCIGVASDEKNDKAYFFFAQNPSTDEARGDYRQLWIDSIIEQDTKNDETTPVVVDVFRVLDTVDNIMGTEDTATLSSGINQWDGIEGSLTWSYVCDNVDSLGVNEKLPSLTVDNVDNIRVGMEMFAYDTTLPAWEELDDSGEVQESNRTNLFEKTRIGAGDRLGIFYTPKIKAISGNTLIFHEPLTKDQIARAKDATHFEFKAPRVLKFSTSHEDTHLMDGVNEYKPNYITGINIIDNLLFWTDGASEPKKINIDRCKFGTAGLTSHTKVYDKNNVDLADLNSNINIHNSYNDTGFTDMTLDNPIEWRINTDLKEEHVTVMRPAPKTPLSLHMSVTDREEVTDVDIGGYAFIPMDGSPLNSIIEVGDIKRIVPESPETLSNTSFRKGDILIFTELDPTTAAELYSPTIIKASFVCYENDDPSSNEYTEEIFESSGVIRVRMLTHSDVITPGSSNWNITLEQRKPLFGKSMVRFGYRYKYEDGEYSAFSPWSEIAFLPGEFDYNSKKAYNLGMVNNLRQLILKDFIPYNRNLDIKSVDILYKATNNQNVYIAQTINRNKDDEWELFTPSPGEIDEIKQGQLTITSEMVNRVLPSNQMLRSWDNVPKVAKTQEVVGNRLVYGNYNQGMDVFDFDLTKNIDSKSLSQGEIKKSVKSIRDYQVGVVFGDQYGRETPVMPGSYSFLSGGGEDDSITGDITVEKTLSFMSNSFSVKITPKDPAVILEEIDQDNFSPAWLNSYVKYYVKETSNEYYNVIMDKWYWAEEGTSNIWLSFNSADRNKLDEETYLLLKNRHGDNQPVLEKARYKIIAIENEAPDFIKTTRNFIGKILGFDNEASYSSGWSTNDVADGAPDGFWSSDNEIKVAAPEWNSSSVGTTYSDEGIFGRKIDGKIEMRIIGRATSGDFQGQELYSDWRTISHYTKDDEEAEYVTLNWNKRYTATMNGGANMRQRFMDLGWAPDDGNVTNLAYDLEFRESIVENKPEFDGKFFVKIENDQTIEDNIISTSPATYDWQSLYVANINYIESTVSNATNQEMTNIGTVDSPEYLPAIATFNETVDDSDNWFFGAFKGCVNYVNGDGDDDVEDDVWFEEPTINHSNHIVGYENSITAVDSGVQSSKKIAEHDAFVGSENDDVCQDEFGNYCPGLANSTNTNNASEMYWGHAIYHSRCWDDEDYPPFASWPADLASDGSVSFPGLGQIYPNTHRHGGYGPVYESEWREGCLPCYMYYGINYNDNNAIGADDSYESGNNYECDPCWDDNGCYVWDYWDIETITTDYSQMLNSDIYGFGKIYRPERHHWKLSGPTAENSNTLLYSWGITPTEDTSYEFEFIPENETDVWRTAFPYDGGIFGRTCGPIYVGNTDWTATVLHNQASESLGWGQYNEMTRNFWNQYAFKNRAGQEGGTGKGCNVFIDGAAAVSYVSSRNFYGVNGEVASGQTGVGYETLAGNSNVAKYFKPTSLRQGVHEVETIDSLGRMNIGVQVFNLQTGVYDGLASDDAADQAETNVRFFTDMTSVGTTFRFQSDPNQHIYRVVWVEDEAGSFTRNHNDLFFEEDLMSEDTYQSDIVEVGNIILPENLDYPFPTADYGILEGGDPYSGCKPCEQTFGASTANTYNPGTLSGLTPNWPGSINDMGQTCSRLNKEIEFRRVDKDTGFTIWNEGFPLTGDNPFDPRAHMKHDGSTSTSVEILQRMPTYSEENVNTELGGCWETEPREDIGLDIYHEASGAIPLVLNKDNVYNFIPPRCEVSVSRQVSTGEINVSSVESDNVVEDVSFLTATNSKLIDDDLKTMVGGPVVKISNYNPYAQEWILKKNDIIKGDILTFIHPNGMQTSSKVVGYAEPSMFRVENANWVQVGVPGVDEGSYGIKRNPYPFTDTLKELQIYSASLETPSPTPQLSETVFLASTSSVINMFGSAANVTGTIITNFIGSGVGGGPPMNVEPTSTDGMFPTSTDVDNVVQIIDVQPWTNWWGECGDDTGDSPGSCFQIFFNDINDTAFETPWASDADNDGPLALDFEVFAAPNGIMYSKGPDFKIQGIVRTGYYEIEPEVWRFPVKLGWHNCYSFGNGVESDRLRDDFNAPMIDNGAKVSTTFSGYGRETIASGLIYSGLYNSISQVNDLNEFNMAEKITKELNPSYGSIQRLKTRDTDMVVFAEDKVLKILANKDALYNADGNPQLTSVDRVLGQAVPFVGDYGISKNPESLAWDQYRMYFTDKQRGAVLRLSRDGLTPISSVGMKTWFRENLIKSNPFYLLGTFDSISGEYNLSLKDFVSAISDTTVSFNEASKGWVSFKSFIPDNGLSINGKYITTKNGKIWEHYIPEYDSGNPLNVESGGDGECLHDDCVERNRFYNEDVNSITESSVTVLFNDIPGTIKSFKTMSYEGSESKIQKYTGETYTNYINTSIESTLNDGEYYNLKNRDGWWVEEIKTNSHSGSLLEFIEKEGKYFNKISGEFKVESEFLETSEYNVQGIGAVSTVTAGITDTNQNDTVSNFDEFVDTGGNIDDSIIVPPDAVPGCIDENACNYNPNANEDDGSCVYGVVYGCTDPNAWNYMESAEMLCPEPYSGNLETGFPQGVDPCTGLPCDQCMYQTEDGGFTIVPPQSTSDDEDASDTNVIYGCTNPCSTNYDAEANTDDGSCISLVFGCTDEDAFNYDVLATSPYIDCDAYTSVELGFGTHVDNIASGETTVEDLQFNCTPYIFGCMDETAVNYNENANADDDSCIESGQPPVVFRITSSTFDSNEIDQDEWPLSDNDEYNTGVNNQPDNWNEDSDEWWWEDIVYPDTYTD